MAISGLETSYAYQKDFYQKSKQTTGSEFQEKMSSTSEELAQKIHDEINEIYTKVKNGDTEPTYQIGAQSYTKTEWDKMLEKFDSIQEDVKKQIEEEKEATEKAEEAKQDTGAGVIAGTTDSDDTVTVSESSIESIVSEFTKCSSPSEDGAKEKIWYITAYTEDGIFCKKCGPIGQSEGKLWEIKYSDPSQHQKVLDFLNRLDNNEDWTFASKESFWQDFLDGKIDENNFMDFTE